MSTIIELSYNNASQKNMTSDWTNTFQQQMMLNPGDGLVSKLCLLDYSSTGQYSNIEIPQDINVSMECGFYYVANNPEYYNSDLTPEPNHLDFNGVEFGKYYVARDYTQQEYPLITSTKNFVLKKGVYDVNELCQEITRTMTTINTPDIGKSIEFDDLAGKYFFRSTYLNEASVNVYTFTQIIQTSEEGENGREWIQYNVVKPANLWQLQPFNVGDTVSFAFQFDPKVNNFSGTLIQIDKVAGTFQIKYYTDSINENATFDDNILFDENLVGVVPPLPYDQYFGIMFKPQSALTPVRFYDPESFNDVFYFTINTRSYMGASQCALLYNDNNDGKFSFKYMHTPLYDSDGNEIVSVLNVAGGTYYYALAQTGIFWTNLEPKELWQDIFGFNLNEMIVSDTLAKYLVPKFTLSQNITSNLITYDDVFNKAKWTESPEADKTYSTRSDDTFKIVGKEQQTAFVSPYFIVQILGLGVANMLDDTKSYQTIAQICSKQYDNNGVITSFSDGIPFFYNTSPEPLLISSLRVRILDGTTKEPTQILGQNNNIFLQIVKAQTP